MKSVLRPARFGLLWLAFAGAGFGATGTTAVVSPRSEAAFYVVTGISLVVISTLLRRRKVTAGLGAATSSDMTPSVAQDLTSTVIHNMTPSVSHNMTPSINTANMTPSVIQ